jgi:hypothetical protein
MPLDGGPVTAGGTQQNNMPDEAIENTSTVCNVIKVILNE